MALTILEHEVAETTKRMNMAVTRHLEETDWEQRRYEIAKDVMSAMLDGKSYYPSVEDCVSLSISYADALIEELRKSKDL